MKIAGLGVVVAVGLMSQTVTAQTFVENVEATETIVIAEAVDQWTERPNVLLVTFRVEHTFNGADRLLLPLEFFEGTVQIGDRAVIFVVAGAGNLIAGVQDYFPINTAPDGTEYVTLHDRQAFSAVDQIGSPILVSADTVLTMTVDAFGAELDRVLRTGLGPESASGDPVGMTSSPFSLIPFPPRDQTFNFFMALEEEYRDGLGRSRTNQGFVNAEGSAVWFPEWLRYVLGYIRVSQMA